MYNDNTREQVMPLIPLRALTVFPCMVLHFDAGREKTIAAIEAAMAGNQMVFLVAQKDARKNELLPGDIYQTGTISRIKQMLKLPGDSVRVLVEGLERADVVEILRSEPYMEALVVEREETTPHDALLMEALQRKALEAFEKYVKLTGKVSNEILLTLGELDNPAHFADILAGHLLVRMEDKQEVLSCYDVEARLTRLLGIIMRETEICKVESRITQQVRKQIDRSQKEYYLREQVRAIQKELGEDGQEIDELSEKLESLQLDDAARKKAEKELSRLAKLPQGSHEYPGIRTWLDWMIELPWGKETQDNLDLKHALQVLDDDHYGLEKVKERIIESLAVRSFQNNTGAILCLVGPPGVGKTSVAASIARAMGRNFVRMSLGGVRDEAEIRGHRRTYIGAIPGRVVTALKQAGSMNPLILFDEVDKMTGDFRGDPASAMLEVLDSAQNHAFRDHYLEVPVDLSKVFFITTANTVEGIPKPLLDRMELIALTSYTQAEKLEIARRHLIPKQVEAHGLAKGSVRIWHSALSLLVSGYTREAGVRTLERQIAAICRKAAREMIEMDKTRIVVSEGKLLGYLGKAPYRHDKRPDVDEVGMATGMAWTAVGGETLTVEVSILKGQGKLELTGSLGDVMKESAHAALSVVRSRAAVLGIDPEFYTQKDLHIHLPEGAIPKDGPSAGVTMATALISALSGIPVSKKVAMTGEITLRGRVLPVGGIKEKVLAAKRAGMETVLLPAENELDWEEIPKTARSGLRAAFVETFDDVLKASLLRMPMPYVAPINLDEMLAMGESQAVIGIRN